jgi:hypothetical protein
MRPAGHRRQAVQRIPFVGLCSVARQIAVRIVTQRLDTIPVDGQLNVLAGSVPMRISGSDRQ